MGRRNKHCKMTCSEQVQKMKPANAGDIFHEVENALFDRQPSLARNHTHMTAYLCICNICCFQSACWILRPALFRARARSKEKKFNAKSLGANYPAVGKGKTLRCNAVQHPKMVDILTMKYHELCLPLPLSLRPRTSPTENSEGSWTMDFDRPHQGYQGTYTPWNLPTSSPWQKATTVIPSES